MKFPIVFRQKRSKTQFWFKKNSPPRPLFLNEMGRRPHFYMKDEKQNNEVQLPDLTDMDEVRKAIIASEILNRKY